MRLVLVGNYGASNLGDEILREYFLRTFPDVQWTVLSAKPSRVNELPRLPTGIRSFFTTPWRKTLKSLRESDGMLMGGGTLMTDAESVFACFLWYVHARVAVYYGKKLYLAFQGVGPFRTNIGERCAVWILRHAAYISVRDDASYARVSSFKLNKEVVQSSDPAISVFVKGKHDVRTKKVLSIIPRHNSSGTLLALARQQLQREAVEEIRIISLQPNHPREQEACESIRRSLPGYVRILPALTAEDLLYAMQNSFLVLSERFHGALAAVCLGLPVRTIPQGAGDKLSALPRPGDIPIELERLRRGEESLRKALTEGARHV